MKKTISETARTAGASVVKVLNNLLYRKGSSAGILYAPILPIDWFDKTKANKLYQIIGDKIIEAKNIILRFKTSFCFLSFHQLIHI